MGKENGHEAVESDSLRDRARASLKRRKKELRTKLILLNAAIAMLVIMVVLVAKVASLNTAMTTGKKVEKPIEQSAASMVPEVTSIPSPTATPTAKIVSGKDRWIRKNLDKKKKMVALTFDDGPFTPVTTSILKTLKKYNAKATFFVVGNRVPKSSDALKQEFALGCQVASHTYEHKYLTGLSVKQIKEQVDKTNKMVAKYIGCPTTALRPPGGNVDARVRKHVGVPMICWDVDTEDWKSRDAKKVLKRCRSITDGNIVLMHDLYPSTAKAVKKLVPYLIKKGFQLVTVDELFYYKGITLENGKVYFNGK